LPIPKTDAAPTVGKTVGLRVFQHESELTTNTVHETAADDQHTSKALTRWRQFIIARGHTLRLLERTSNIAIQNPANNTVVIRGGGAYFPEFRGSGWAAMCAPCTDTDIPLDDVRPILEMLIREAPLAVTDAARDEVEKFVHGAG
jgi:hypothetical protein